jgi:hypothetical protein
MSEQKRHPLWTVHELIDELEAHAFPSFRVLLVPELFLYPSPWCERFRIEVDQERGVVRFLGDFT